jgi:GNAT superfamily N-acetyltransferase
LFHATVDNHWVDVFFDRSEFNDTLHITFAVNGDYDTPSQPTGASKSTVRILSTVLNIIKKQLPEYIAKARPPGISFTAKGDNRASLYRKYFVPVVQNILGPKWQHEEYPSMGMTVFHWKPVHKNTDKELSEIARIPQGDFGDKDTLYPMATKPKTKPLPGGNQFSYAVNKTSEHRMEIMIFDGDTLAAELDLYATLDPLNTWEVESVVTDPDYRGQGLGKALYGIALSILKLTVEAGEIQTKHGQQMWLMLNSIPGVEVKGYAMTPTDEYRQKRGDTVVDQNATWTRYTFPVEPGSRSMRSTRRGTGIYSSNRVSMIAKWTGR